MSRLFALVLLAAAAPAWAGGSITIPEPGDAALFVLAVGGLIVGRHASRKPPRRDG